MADLGCGKTIINSMTERGNPRVVMHVLSMAVPLIAAVASNFFLLLATAALVPRRGFVNLIWRLRVPIDLVIVLVPFLAHSRWRMP